MTGGGKKAEEIQGVITHVGRGLSGKGRDRETADEVV